MTPVTPMGSVLGHEGISSNPGRIRGHVRHRRSVPRLSAPATVAGWIPVFGMWFFQGVADSQGQHELRKVREAGLSDGWHDLARDTPDAEAVVPGDLVGNEPEERYQCVGIEAGARFGQLSDGVAHVAQVAAGHGATGSRPAGGPGRSGRDLCWRCASRQARTRSGSLPHANASPLVAAPCGPGSSLGGRGRRCA